MAKRLGNVVSARYWDNEARKHAKRAAELDACADKAHTAPSRERWRRMAQAEREKQKDCLEKAKTLDCGDRG
jgi:hypothetical protein